jgi:uncharacterized protein
MSADPEPPTTSSPPRLTPVAEAERIDSLDVLRGFALLGILVMNIQAFSMPMAAYMNPTAYGDLTGANLWVWILSHLFADQKFMTIFSALFGAGIVLMWQRAEARGRKATGLHYRRTFWLMVFGLVHAYLMWSGDILVFYSLCSLWVFWFKRRTPRTLIIVGLLVLLVAPALYLLAGYSMPSWPPEAVDNFAVFWRPSEAKIAEIIGNYQGGIGDQMGSRVEEALNAHIGGFLFWALWRAGGLMLLGMALFKLGFFSAELSDRVYRRCIAVGAVVGLPLVAYGVYRNFALQWDLSRFFLGSEQNYFGSLLVSLAYAAGIMLVCKHNALPRITAALANVGRMALTNYLLQTIIATTIFYGHGLGYFGQVSRVGQILIVLAIWAVQIPLSAWWLKRFRFGPFEWLWRTLSYMKPQPMLRVPVSSSG